MEITLICGHCGKKGHNPGFHRTGKKVKCEHCGEWQTFKGTMESVKER